jgi:hypothetical protein
VGSDIQQFDPDSVAQLFKTRMAFAHMATMQGRVWRHDQII